MGELINGRTAEEIKRGIKCHVSWGDCSTECPYDDVRNKPAHECIQSMTKDAHALIERLEGQVPRWISVEERLPEVKGKYIVCTRKKAVYCTAFRFFHGEGYFATDLNTHITHWMPLPEPPKEGA